MSDQITMSKAELLAKIEVSWSDFNAYIKTLTEEQLTQFTDAAGWTIKDHIIHLAMWEDSIYAAILGENRRERMGVDKETWKTEGFDKINAAIQQLHKDRMLTDVLNTFEETHQHVLEKLESLSDADLARPYSHYQPYSTLQEPILEGIIGATYEHYEEHKPWIQAIAEGN